MRKSFFTLTLISLSLFFQAKAEDSVLTYYMPFTELVFDVQYEKVVEQAGVFYQYAERYLGTKQALQENKVYYRLTDIKMSSRAVADKNRPHEIALDKKTLQEIIVYRTTDERLMAVNKEVKECPFSKQQKNKQSNYKAKDKPATLAPLQEEQMLVGSISKMAENTAKLIYHIREQRLNLLSGEAEHQPADGQSLKLTLDELQKQENELCELFVGKTCVIKEHKQIVYRPMGQVDEQCLLRFSYFNGIVASDDLSGEPIYLTVNATIITPPNESDKKKKETAPSPIYYNLQGEGEIIVTSAQEEYIRQTLPIAQFGYSKPLPQELFMKNKPQIEFDQNTGNIKSIQ